MRPHSIQLRVLRSELVKVKTHKVKTLRVIENIDPNNPNTVIEETILELTGESTFGRKSHNDIQVELGTVSGYHCRILMTKNGWMIENLESTNGTYIDFGTNRSGNVLKLKGLAVGEKISLSETEPMFQVRAITFSQ